LDEIDAAALKAKV
jgi:hypothetical protein